MRPTGPNTLRTQAGRHSQNHTTKASNPFLRSKNPIQVNLFGGKKMYMAKIWKSEEFVWKCEVFFKKKIENIWENAEFVWKSERFFMVQQYSKYRFFDVNCF